MTKDIRKDFLVSIHPTYAEKIVDGAKTVELRRRFARNIDPGAHVLIYSTSPIQAIIGCAAIKGVRCLPLQELWSKYGRAACIARKDFDGYFDGLESGYAILLGKVRKFKRSYGAAHLREKFGFTAPQSFRYLPAEYYSLLSHERLQITH